jgi:2-oxoglutarate ferredoxin oxidoreductase subunit gamma
MQTELIIAGFGGQGVLFAGQLLAYTAMEEGLEVTWIPSYGPEMRGGTANCTVVISDDEIGSPLVRNPQVLLALNRPSLDKYEQSIRAGGLLVANASLIDRPVERTDLRTVMVPANEIAEGIGSIRMTNMVMLGSLIANLPIVSQEAVIRAVRAHTSARHQNLISANIEAIQAGAAYLAEAVA